MFAEFFTVSLEGFPDIPHLREAADVARSLRGVMGFDMLWWQEQDQKITTLKTTSRAGSGQDGSTRQHHESTDTSRATIL